MKRILLLLILIASFSCTSNNNDNSHETIESKLYGGWVNQNENRWITLFPDKFESWNLNNLSDEGHWRVKANSLYLTTSDSTKEIKFAIQTITNESLELVSESGALIPFSRRKYGEFSAQLLGDLKKATIGIDRTCAGIHEVIKDLPVSGSDSQIQTLGLWLMNGIPLRLAVTEPNPDKGISGFSEYYFQGGMLRYEIAPKETLIFEDEKLVLWLGENGEQTGADADELEKKQDQILKSLSKFLDVYGFVMENGIFIPKEEIKNEPSS